MGSLGNLATFVLLWGMVLLAVGFFAADDEWGCRHDG